jgi:hypothetical protein
MTETRLRGQEVTLRIAQGNIVQTAITAFKSFNVQYDTSIIEQGYLGETQNRFDDIIKGCSGAFAVDAEGPEVLVLNDFVAQRAQRRQNPNVQVNITGAFSFPDGRTPRLLIKDIKFDPMNVQIGARDQYVGVAYSYKGPVPKLIQT